MAERRLVFAHDVKELLNGLESLPWEEEVDFLVDALPTPADVEVVVHCYECVLHGHCRVEDTFEFAEKANPFCCVGKRRTNQWT